MIRTPDATRLFQRGGQLVRSFATGAAGVWVAASVVRGIQLDGPAGRQVLAVLVAAIVFELPGLRVLARRVLPRSVLHSCVRSLGGCLGAGLVVVTGALVVVAMGPILLWLSAVICEVLGLPLRVAGFWPIVVGALVFFISGLILAIVWESLTARGRASGRPGQIARLAVCLVALGLIVVMLDGVRLIEGGSWWRQLLVLIILAALFDVVNIRARLRGPRTMMLRFLPLLAGYAVVANALMLWLIVWLSDGLLPTLQIDGFGTYLLAALISTAVMWTANLPFMLRDLLRHQWLAVRTSRFGYLRLSRADLESQARADAEWFAESYWLSHSHWSSPPIW